MKSALIGVILRGIFLLAGNKIYTAIAMCPACSRACPGQGAGYALSGSCRQKEQELTREEECLYCEGT